jgi:PKD repeat protein
MKLKKLLIWAILALPFINVAQEEIPHHCAFDEIYEQLQKDDPEAWEQIKIEREELNEFIREHIAQQKIAGAAQKSSYTIPVVFHVLHDGGPENISYEQILSAIDRLNECFNGTNAEVATVNPVFTPLIDNIGVNFKLAKRAPDGTCFNGVTRTKSPETFSGNESSQLNAIINGNDVFRGIWRSDQYLNIFVVNTLGSAGAAAYAYFPSGDGSSMNNGVWSQHRYMGSIGTSNAGNSAVVVHELGHWFSLFHPWGSKNLVGSNNPVPADCGRSDNNDFVADTPKTIGNKTCTNGIDTCTDDDPYWAGRGFPTPMIDNVENFMEYTYCFKMFTIGQGDRMKAALNNSTGGRNNLWKAANLPARGVDDPEVLCKVNFDADKYLICEGESISFKDMSYFGQTSWTWTFEGADVTSSGSQNPTVSYSTAGNYSVTLQTSDGTNTMSATKTAFITVLPNPGYNVAFSESFENISSLPTERWMITDDRAGDYSISTAASVSGSKSLRITNSSSRAGNVYELTSATYDFSGDNFPYITFKYAFAKRTDANNDALRVLVSKDCGKTWTLRKSISATNLPTAENTNATFVPAESEWKFEEMTNLTSDFATSNFRVKFEFTSGGGNHLYLEDINIFGDVSLNTINTEAGVEAIKYFPNPSSGNDVSLSINLTNTSNVTVNIYDVVGKKIQSVNLGMVQGGKHALPLNLNQLSTGTYLFETLINGVPASKDKLVIN